MQQKRSFQILVSLALLTAGTLITVWYSGHRPIARHNASLQAATGKAVRVEINTTPRYGPDGPELPAKPTVVITDRSEIDRMLGHFKLAWHQWASGLSHECGGHLRLRIVMPDSTEHALRYDHGNGIYPITTGDEFPGFSYLPENACAFLSGYFASLGYSAEDLGIAE